MGSADQIHVVGLQEVGHNVLAKHKADSSLILVPAVHLFLWVGPEKIAQQALVGNLDWPDDLVDLFEIL